MKVVASQVSLANKLLEYQLDGVGKPNTWISLKGDWKKDTLSSEIKVPAGGWYKLEIRAAENPAHRLCSCSVWCR